MHSDFWIERWRENRIGFHEGKPNGYLEHHVARLGERRRVLVPMCGKSYDLAFLAAQGHTVIGIELVEDAVRAFFDERMITPAVERRDLHAEYTAGPITIFAGDLFAITREHVGAVDALYDRAAIVALPPELRPSYAAHIRSLLAPASPALVVSLEYPDGVKQPPPFSVPDAELASLYGAGELLEQGPDLRIPGGIERCFFITL
ncbi:MAG: thiopurine S-methyltransferase [Kofleriaceae bacterium]